MEPSYIDSFTRQFPIRLETTALVIVDMQYASGSREHGLGKLLASQGQLDAAADRFDRIEQLIVPNIQRLLAFFRNGGGMVVYITLGPQLADFGDAPIHLRDWFRATNNHAGTREHEIIDALKPQAGELVLNKTTIGAFASTGIDAALKARNIGEVIVTGVSTNNCVGMTAMEAADRQYGVVLADDATGTCSQTMQDATTRTFRRLWGRVMTTDEILDELGGESRVRTTG